jgi:hypothetical protein
MSRDKALPRRHTKNWFVLVRYHDHKPVEVMVKSLDTQRELFTGDDLEQDLIDADRAARCVNACDLLNADRPDLEIEALLRDRARLMEIMAKQGYKRPAVPDMVLKPGSDDVPAEHESIYPVTDDGRKQIGPLDI